MAPFGKARRCNSGCGSLTCPKSLLSLPTVPISIIVIVLELVLVLDFFEPADAVLASSIGRGFVPLQRLLVRQGSVRAGDGALSAPQATFKDRGRVRVRLRLESHLKIEATSPPPGHTITPNSPSLVPTPEAVAKPGSCSPAFYRFWSLCPA